MFIWYRAGPQYLACLGYIGDETCMHISCNSTRRVADATPGSTFHTNNLFSDLAPLLALFGEQVAKQYLSQSLSWLDCAIFAMAPLGIITAIVSAIRVAGPIWLRAVIGRARESKGDAELELMSSTSIDVCELWNGRSVVRAIGESDITEVFRLEEVDSKPTDPRVALQQERTPTAAYAKRLRSLPTEWYQRLLAKLFPTPQSQQRPELDNSISTIFSAREAQSHRLLYKLRHPDAKPETSQTNGDTESKNSSGSSEEKPNPPKISLNILGDPTSKLELVLVAFTTTILQLGLRGMNYLASLVQLGAIGVVTLLRVMIQRHLNDKPQTQQIENGYELEWMAKRLSRCSHWSVRNLINTSDKLEEWRDPGTFDASDNDQENKNDGGNLILLGPSSEFSILDYEMFISHETPCLKLGNGLDDLMRPELRIYRDRVFGYVGPNEAEEHLAFKTSMDLPELRARHILTCCLNQLLQNIEDFKGQTTWSRGTASSTGAGISTSTPILQMGNSHLDRIIDILHSSGINGTRQELLTVLISTLQKNENLLRISDAFSKIYYEIEFRDGGGYDGTFWSKACSNLLLRCLEAFGDHTNEYKLLRRLLTRAKALKPRNPTQNHAGSVTVIEPSSNKEFTPAESPITSLGAIPMTTISSPIPHTMELNMVYELETADRLKGPFSAIKSNVELVPRLLVDAARLGYPKVVASCMTELLEAFSRSALPIEKLERTISEAASASVESKRGGVVDILLSVLGGDKAMALHGSTARSGPNYIQSLFETSLRMACRKVDGKIETLPLYLAAAGGFADVIALILYSGVTPAREGPEGACPEYTFLHHAADHGTEATIDIVASPTLNLQWCLWLLFIRDNSGHYALEAHYVKLLLENGVSIETRDPTTGYNLFLSAAMNGKVNTIELLLKRGVDIEARDPTTGYTPLLTAAVNRRANAIKFLLERGANTLAKGLRGTNFHAAGNYIRFRFNKHSAKGFEGYIDLILRLFPKRDLGAAASALDEKGNSLLVYAAGTGSRNTCERLLKYMKSDFHTKQLELALHLAFYGGRLDIVEILVEAGIQTNRPLQGFDCLKLFIHRGIETKPTTEELEKEQSILHLAIMCKSPEVFAAIIKAGADINLPLQAKRPLLHFALSYESGDPSWIPVLCSYGIDINAVDKDGKTALIIDIEKSKASTTNILIDNGATWGRGEIFKAPELIEAIKFGGSSLFLLLCKRHKKVMSKEKYQNYINTPGAYGPRPVHVAARYHNDKILESLWLEGAGMHAKDKRGCNALSHALESRSTMQLLMSVCRIDPNERQAAQEYTAAHIAVRTISNPIKIAETLQVLWNFGADFNLKDKAGNTSANYITFASRRPRLQIRAVVLPSKETSNVAWGEDLDLSRQLGQVFDKYRPDDGGYSREKIKDS
ncbi:hypothetical protein TWF103_001869 [Orbilia oligospora]|nr:hypothetical protein TWF103_001869 [Orbilia oligospora]